MKKNNTWFSIIEILIWMFIFTLWLLSIYALVIHTINLNEYSKNSIIASNLAREWIEIVRNIRDNNYKDLYRWNKLPWNDVYNLFSTWVYYKWENDFSTSTSLSVNLEEISDFWEWKDYLSSKMQNYVLCLNNKNQYTHNCSTSNKKTYFYRYLKFDDVKYNSWWTQIVLDDAIKLTSKVIWYNRWYHEVELKTILSDFLRQ